MLRRNTTLSKHPAGRPSSQAQKKGNMPSPARFRNAALLLAAPVFLSACALAPLQPENNPGSGPNVSAEEAKAEREKEESGNRLKFLVWAHGEHNRMLLQDAYSRLGETYEAADLLNRVLYSANLNGYLSEVRSALYRTGSVFQLQCMLDLLNNPNLEPGLIDAMLGATRSLDTIKMLNEQDWGPFSSVSPVPSVVLMHRSYDVLGAAMKNPNVTPGMMRDITASVRRIFKIAFLVKADELDAIEGMYSSPHFGPGLSKLSRELIYDSRYDWRKLMGRMLSHVKTGEFTEDMASFLLSHSKPGRKKELSEMANSLLCAISASNGRGEEAFSRFSSLYEKISKEHGEEIALAAIGETGGLFENHYSSPKAFTYFGHLVSNILRSAGSRERALSTISSIGEIFSNSSLGLEDIREIGGTLGSVMRKKGEMGKDSDEEEEDPAGELLAAARSENFGREHVPLLALIGSKMKKNKDAYSAFHSFSKFINSKSYSPSLFADYEKLSTWVLRHPSQSGMDVSFSRIDELFGKLDAHPKIVSNAIFMLNQPRTNFVSASKFLMIAAGTPGFSESDDISQTLESGREFSRFLGASHRDAEACLNLFYGRNLLGRDMAANLFLAYGLEFFARYPRELLEEVYTGLGDASYKQGYPVIFIALNKNDHNGAFYDSAAKLLPEVLEGNRVFAIETSNDADIYSAPGNLYPPLPPNSHRIRTVILSGHGQWDLIIYGRGGGRSNVTQNDISRMRALRGYLSPEVLFILESCSTGKGPKSIGARISRGMGVRLLAPTEAGSLHKLLHDDGGRITGAEFSVPHNEFMNGEIVSHFDSAGGE